MTERNSLSTQEYETLCIEMVLFLSYFNILMSALLFCIFWVSILLLFKFYMMVSFLVLILNLYIYNVMIKSHWQHRVPRLSLAIHPNHSSFLVGLLGCILCLHRANVSLCLSTNTGTSMWRSPQENIANEVVFTSPVVPHVLFKWCVRWEASGHTVAVLWGVASWISSR